MADEYLSLVFNFKNADISCVNCRSVRALAACSNLTYEDFEELESITVGTIKIEIYPPVKKTSLDKYLTELEFAITAYILFIPYFIDGYCLPKGG